MIGVLLPVLLAGQSPAARPPAAPPVNAEQQVRKMLTAQGMSPAGIGATFAINRRHDQTHAAIMRRGQAAESGIRAALTKRPVDVDGFAAGMAARTDATIALQREAAQMAVEQMRALSPADRVVLVKIMTTPPPSPPR